MADAKSSDVDPYGFVRGPDFDRDQYEDFFSNYLPVLAKRASQWKSVVGSRGSIKKSGKLKRYCRKGIPGEYRVRVWMAISGAQHSLETNKGLYQRYLQGPHDEQLVTTIETDIPRTFPDNIFFKDMHSDRSGRKRPLFNVLLALAKRNANIGYCQGLNFVAGMLLLVVKDEEKVFWLTDSLINHILPDYFSSTMAGVKVDQEVLTDLVREKLPDVYDVLKKHSVHLSLVTTKWFICCFADVLPTETLLRVWDSLFYEGNKIIFRVALTIIKETSSDILSAKMFLDVVEAFKGMMSKRATLECHQFMEKVFSEPGSLSRSKIAKLRSEHLNGSRPDTVNK